MPFIQNGGTGGGAGSIQVTDGVTTVNPTSILDFTSGVTVTNAGGGQANAAVTGSTPTFSVQTTKTANFTASGGQFVPCDLTGGGFTITLPAAPTNGSIVFVQRAAGASNTLTVAAGAGDTIDAGTITSIVVVGDTVQYVYRSSDKVWFGSYFPVSVTAADTSVVIGGSAAAPTVRTGTLDVIATQHPPAASVPMGTQKLTGLAAGTVNGDSVRFEQALLTGAVTAADTSVVIGGTGVAPTVRTNTVDVIATQHPAAADWSNNSHKITSLAAATANGDAVRWELILTNFYKSGAAIWAPGDTGGFSANALTQSQLNAFPVFIYGGKAIVFSSVAVSVTTSAGGSTIRLGWYDVASDGGPGALLYDLGTVDSTGTGVKTISSSFTIGPGLVWFAAVAQGGAPSVRIIAAGAIPAIGQLVGSASVLTATPTAIAQASAAAAGALPNPFSTYTMPNAPIMPRFLAIVT